MLLQQKSAIFKAEIKDIDAQLKPFFDELGLDFPFDVEGK